MAVIAFVPTHTPTPTRTKITRRDILLRAADILEEWEWIQCNWYSDENGRSVNVREATHFCATGAIGRACVDLGLTYGYRLGIQGNAPNGEHWLTFNDRKGRTKQEVVAALREAADEC